MKVASFETGHFFLCALILLVQLFFLLIEETLKNKRKLFGFVLPLKYRLSSCTDINYIEQERHFIFIRFIISSPAIGRTQLYYLCEVPIKQ